MLLVAVGAAAFADLGLRLHGVEGGTRIIAYVVSGIGFLGAGVILKDGAHIRDLNTAAWAVAIPRRSTNAMSQAHRFYHLLPQIGNETNVRSGDMLVTLARRSSDLEPAASCLTP